MEDKDLRKENLRIDNLRNMITRDINIANLPIGTVYYILKDALNEIGSLFTEQANKEYKEFCDLMNKEDAEADNTKKESNSEIEEMATANINEERAR